MEGDITPCCTEAFTFIPPLAPLLVVIITTPFAALDPYKEVEAASLRIVNEAISSWFIVLSSPSYSISSTINNGSVSPFRVPTTRITIPGDDPGPCAEVN